MNTTILKFRAATRPSSAVRNAADLLELFALDRLPAKRARLVAHWYAQPNGRLACIWEPDLSPKIRR